MPYNPGTGIYTLPAVYLAVPGTAIIAAQHNTPLEDLEVANNYARPIVAGGTGANNATDARANLGIADPVNPVSVGMVMDYAGAAAPSLWLLLFGQAVSRTTYAALFAVTGTTYGIGDGSTTFNLPDLRGRVTAGKDNMGGVSADRLTTFINGDILGNAVGGVESIALSTANLAAHTHTSGTLSGSALSAGVHTHDLTSGTTIGRQLGAGTSAFAAGANDMQGTVIALSAGAHTHAVDINGGATGSSGSGTGHNNVQPTIILNKIIYAGV